MMLITFQSHAYSDITMFGEIGLQMIGMMGHDQSASGAIKAADIPQALSRLQSAIAAHKQVLEAPTNHDNDDQEEEPVSLATRAAPLLDMLKAAADDNCDVMWQSN